MKESTDTLMIERHRLVFDKGCLVFQEKSDLSQLLAISVREVCDAMTFPATL